MRPASALTNDELVKEWESAQFFYNGTSAKSDDPFEATMHREADARIAECEEEMGRREFPAQDHSE